MARVDYAGIADAIRARVAAQVPQAVVTVERDVLMGFERTPWVNVRAVRRETTMPQPIAAGTRTRFRVHYVCECWESGLGPAADVARRRDDLLGQVEVALMGDRTLGGKVDFLFLEGGEFFTGQEGDHLFIGGEVAVAVEVEATT